MKPEYKEWIVKYLERHNNAVLGKCTEATKEMKEAFPELTVVPGHVFTDWGQRGHMWLTDSGDQIVDPTRSQFNLIFEYVPWTPGQSVRVGRCMNCGDEIWVAVQTLDKDPGHRSICSDACGKAMEDELNNIPGVKII